MLANMFADNEGAVGLRQAWAPFVEIPGRADDQVALLIGQFPRPVEAERLGASGVKDGFGFGRGGVAAGDIGSVLHHPV